MKYMIYTKKKIMRKKLLVDHTNTTFHFIYVIKNK